LIRNYQTRIDVIRNGATLTQLIPVTPPTIDCDASGEIKTSMGGEFLDNPAVNWITDELKPYQIIDGKEAPVGVFAIGTFYHNTDENGVAKVTVEAYDRALYLMQGKTQNILHLSAGTNYVQAIEQLLLVAGITLYSATPTSEVLSTDREDWDVGTPYLTIVNALLNEINYDSIWFDRNGYAMVHPIKRPSASNIDHQYGNDQKLRVLQRPCTIETDSFDASNVFMVICSNPDLGSPLVSKAVNNNPLSSLSTVNRGREILSVTQVDNIPSQAVLDEYAQRLCFDSMSTSEILTISTINLPGHGVRDTVALHHPDAQGIYQEIAWSLVLSSGEVMTHKLKRSVII